MVGDDSKIKVGVVKKIWWWRIAGAMFSAMVMVRLTANF
jgi:hypothetical protein